MQYRSLAEDASGFDFAIFPSTQIASARQWYAAERKLRSRFTRWMNPFGIYRNIFDEAGQNVLSGAFQEACCRGAATVDTWDILLSWAAVGAFPRVRHSILLAAVRSTIAQGRWRDTLWHWEASPFLWRALRASAVDSQIPIGKKRSIPITALVPNLVVTHPISAQILEKAGMSVRSLCECIANPSSNSDDITNLYLWRSNVTMNWAESWTRTPTQIA